MSGGFKSFLQRWIINTLAVLVATYLVSGIQFQKPIDLLVATLILVVLNEVARPLLMLISMPLVILTLGIFIMVINAGLLLLVSAMLHPKFQVNGFWPAFWGALVIAIVNMLLNSMTKTGNSRISVQQSKVPPRRRGDDNDGGPVIDV